MMLRKHRLLRLAAANLSVLCYEDDPSFHLFGYDVTVFKTDNDVAYLLKGRRHTFLVFRGSDDFADWVSNLKRGFVWAGKAARVAIGEGEKVHSGIYNDFAKFWPEIRECLHEVKGPLYYAGHSRGAVFATLAARFFPPELLITLGSPRVGNKAFCDAISCPVERYVHGGDLVTRLPKFGYVHKGGRYHIDDGVVEVSDALSGAPWRLFRGARDHAGASYLKAFRAAFAQTPASPWWAP